MFGSGCFLYFLIKKVIIFWLLHLHSACSVCYGFRSYNLFLVSSQLTNSNFWCGWTDLQIWCQFRHLHPALYSELWAQDKFSVFLIIVVPLWVAVSQEESLKMWCLTKSCLPVVLCEACTSPLRQKRYTLSGLPLRPDRRSHPELGIRHFWSRPPVVMHLDVITMLAYIAAGLYCSMLLPACLWLISETDHFNASCIIIACF